MLIDPQQIMSIEAANLQPGAIAPKNTAGVPKTSCTDSAPAAGGHGVASSHVDADEPKSHRFFVEHSRDYATRNEHHAEFLEKEQKERTQVPTITLQDPPRSDRRLARAELRRQIASLEHRLASRFTEAFPRLGLDVSIGAPAGDLRVLGLGELERIRDALVGRIAEAQVALDKRAASEAGSRQLLEQMLAAPAEFKWMRISRSEVGEPGCGHWHSRPRFGLLGMLMGWWRIKISSGCP